MHSRPGRDSLPRPCYADTDSITTRDQHLLVTDCKECRLSCSDTTQWMSESSQRETFQHKHLQTQIRFRFSQIGCLFTSVRNIPMNELLSWVLMSVPQVSAKTNENRMVVLSIKKCCLMIFLNIRDCVVL